jgi:hypothetical protein
MPETSENAAEPRPGLVQNEKLWPPAKAAPPTLVTALESDTITVSPGKNGRLGANSTRWSPFANDSAPGVTPLQRPNTRKLLALTEARATGASKSTAMVAEVGASSAWRAGDTPVTAS